ncbi:type VII secretion-associated protein [Corynebacterium sp. HMSC069E04]|uniref:type VII secretion-associated protein n=1 Tax=Corynebacterium sp. HMSC069E04 TaxID=1739400 RepID=UPI0008A4C90E|nr:type VII secretion-associated protein [Corynebacterium sp. HMSC069E04]OFS40533.1 type VII secretion-associated protein [Corynebacterium sp. HMSC069E04]
MTTTHALRTPTTAPETTLAITVLDAATIYEGPETIYRYDLPGTGIAEGWALEAVLDQAEKVCGAEWPDISVDVVADPSGTEVSVEAVSILRRQLAGAGATVQEPEPLPPSGVGAVNNSLDAVLSEVGGQQEPSDDEKTLTTELSRPVRRRRSHRAAESRWSALLGGIDPFYIAIAVMVLVVAGVSWWAVGRKDAAVAASTPDQTAEGASAASGTSGTASNPDTEAQPEGPAEGAGAEETGSRQLRPGQQAIDVEGMSLVLPQGFRTSVEDGLVTAAGEDPNLRILLAADPLFNVPVDVLFTEIKEQIESDPALRDPVEDSGRLTYTEDPGDGSRVTWMMWEDKGHQMSVGCHTKFEPNVVQKAACRMAAESLVKKD